MDVNIPGLCLTGKGLHIYHHNVCSLFSKLDELRHLLRTSIKCVDVYGVTETHLSLSISDCVLSVPGYNLHRRDRLQNKYGGVAAYVSHKLCAERRKDLESEHLESLWLEIKQVSAKSVLLGFIYRPPNSAVEWYQLFEQESTKVIAENKHVVLLGDFNIDMFSENGSRWSDLFESFGMSQLINEPTRVTSKSSTLIDHILVTNPIFAKESKCMTNVSLSDHYPVGLCWRYFTSKADQNNKHKVISYRRTCDINFPEFRDKIATDLQHISFSENVDKSVSDFNTTITNEIDRTAPLITKRVKIDKQPMWFTHNISLLIQKRNQYKKKKDYDNYRLYRSKVSKEIKCAKKKHIINMCYWNPRETLKYCGKI
jgi:exonuclease III